MAVLFAALVVPLLIDWSSYRASFEREASRLLGQPVTVRGKAEVRMLPFPSVSFGDVIVGEDRDGEPMMRIDRFSMDVELAPFLSGEIRIFDMRVENPFITVRLSSTGELDWALRGEKALPSQALTFENIQVTNGAVRLFDEQNSREHLLENLDMRMSAMSISGPWQADGSVTADGRRARFALNAGSGLEKGVLRLKARILPEAAAVALDLDGSLGIENFRPLYKGAFELRTLGEAGFSDENHAPAPGERSLPNVQLTGVGELTSKRLRIEDYRLEIGMPGNPYVISGEATLDTGREPEFLLVADGQQVDLAQWFDPAGGTDGGEAGSANGAPIFPAGQPVAGQLAELRRLISLVPVPQMPGRLSVALPAVVIGDASIRDIVVETRSEGGTWSIDSIRATLPGRTTLEAAGKLRSGRDFGFDGEMTIASRQPSGFAAWMGGNINPVLRRLDGAGLSAKVALSDRAQRFEDMEVVLGRALFRGRLERVAPDTGRPSISLSLAGDRVNMDALRALAGPFLSEDGQGPLAGHDVSARLSVQRFEVVDATANNADLAIRLKGATLDIDRLTVGDLAGASLSGVGRLENVFAAPSGYVDASATTVDSAPALQLLARLGGGYPVLEHLSANAALFGNMSADAQLRFAEADGGVSGVTATIRGRAGASRFSVHATRPNAFAPFGTGRTTLRAEVSSNTPRLLLEQLGIGSSPANVFGSASAEARFEGAPVTGIVFSARYDAPDMQVSMRGTARHDENEALQGAFRLAFMANDLAPYLAGNGLDLDGLDARLPVEVDADVETGARALRFRNMRGHAGATQFSGDVALTRGKAAGLSGSIALSRLDLVWLAETMLGRDRIVPVRAGEPVLGQVSFTPPRKTGLALDLHVEALAARMPFGPDTGEWSGKLVFKDDEMQWREIKADWLGGVLRGGLALANRKAAARLSVELRLEDGDLAPFVWRRDGLPAAKGRFGLTLSLDGAGTSVREVVASLSGSGIVSADGLEFAGFEDEALAPILSAADAEGFEATGETVTALVERYILTGRTYADRLSAPFTIVDGILRIPTIAFSSATATGRGEARAGLADGTVNARFEIEFDPLNEALPGAVPVVGVAYDGPLAAPVRIVDAVQLGNFLKLRALERERRRVELVQAVLIENQRLRREAVLAKRRKRVYLAAIAERERREAERKMKLWRDYYAHLDAAEEEQGSYWKAVPEQAPGIPVDGEGLSAGEASADANGSEKVRTGLNAPGAEQERTPRARPEKLKRGGVALPSARPASGAVIR